MRFLELEETNGITNPAVDIWVQQAGSLFDPFSIRWRIDFVDPVTMALTEFKPWTDLNMVDDRIGIGHFAPSFTAPSTTGERGLYKMEVEVVMLEDDDPIRFERDFDVLSKTEKRWIAGRRVYALLSDALSGGISGATSQARVSALANLAAASIQIEGFTNRIFGIIAKTVRVDGRGAPDLLVNEPIVGLSRVEILSHAFGAESILTEAALEDLSVYNRHLSQNLTDPDDRDDPKISFYRLHDFLGRRYHETRPLYPYDIFPFGQQNVVLEGAFGFTEWDGSPSGEVPVLIRRVCVLLAKRLGSAMNGSLTPPIAGPVIEERTRDQSVKYASPKDTGGAAFGVFTGDPEIDNILLMFSRPARIGAA